MAAFSYQQYHRFLLDPLLLPPNAPFKVSGFNIETEENYSIFNTTTTSMNSLLCPPEQVLIQENSNNNSNNPVDCSKANSLDHSLIKVNNGIIIDENSETSITKKQSTTETSSAVVVDKLESGEQVSQALTAMNRKRRNGSSLTSAQSKGGREGKSKKKRKCNEEEEEREKEKTAGKKEERKGSDEAPKDYIHVRARRGQATDSHSLAERVRREKISERMRVLQKLVPGCDKVTGKALMLDEIINYVQSLQNQVEFLSMKLSSLNPVFYDFGVDLDAFMVRSEGLVGLASSMPHVQHMGPTQPTAAFADALVASPTAHHCPPLMDNTSPTLLQLPQDLRPNPLLIAPQDNESILREVEDQRQKFLNPSGFVNNLCSFH